MRRFILGGHPQARDRAIQAVREAENGLEVIIKPQSRSSAGNALLHALIADVARQLEWAGKKQTQETWKRLLVAAWSRVRGEPLTVLPALDGSGVDIIPVRTSKLTKGECADLIEFIYAWGTEHGVQWSDQSAA
jgi:hypothetical protein